MTWSLLFAVALSARALLPFAVNSFSADPEIRIEDAYKWLFQAANGGEHAIPDEETARQWLEREWKSLGPTPSGESLEIPIRPDGELVRVNLRPLRDRGGDPGELLRAFLRSARAFEPDPELFRASWAALGDELSARPLGPLNRAEWSRLDAAMRSKGYPAIEHSRSYIAARHPAYRVLTKEEAARLVGPAPEEPPAAVLMLALRTAPLP